MRFQIGLDFWGQEGFPGEAQWSRIYPQCRRGRFGPWSGRSPGEGNGNPLQYSCLENPMDGGAWRAAVHRFAESDTTE